MTDRTEDAAEGSDAEYLSYTGQEPVYACMFCGDRKMGRGMNGHVRLKSDEKHGPRGDMPDAYALSECELVGFKSVDVDRKKGAASHTRYYCTFCGRIARGKSGLGVHIIRSDDRLHPNDEHEIDYSDHLRFPADMEQKIIWVPADVHPGIVTLSEAERETGWNVKSDPTFEIGREVLIPDKEAALKVLSEECMDYVRRAEDIDPVEAYRLLLSVLRRLPEVNANDDDR